MNVNRNLILNILVSSILFSVNAIAQQPVQIDRESAHVYTGRNSPSTKIVPSRTQVGNQPSRPYSENRAEQTQAAVVVPSQSVVEVSTPNQDKSNQHVYSPKRHGVKSANVDKPIARKPQQAVLTIPQKKPVAPNVHAYDREVVVLNAKPVRERPIIIQRPLPQTIVINKRSAICPFATLTPLIIAKKGNFIELNDGSVWKVRHRDRNKVRKWSPNDAIVIETGKFFSWHAYSLVNYSRGETIDVELYLTDNWSGSASHWIAEINPIQGFVRLENGSIWRMSTSELASWTLNDDVIIGLSRDWFSNQYNYILINPKAKNRFTALLEL